MKLFRAPPAIRLVYCLRIGMSNATPQSRCKSNKLSCVPKLLEKFHNLRRSGISIGRGTLVGMKSVGSPCAGPLTFINVFPAMAGRLLKVVDIEWRQYRVLARDLRNQISMRAHSHSTRNWHDVPLAKQSDKLHKTPLTC